MSLVRFGLPIVRPMMLGCQEKKKKKEKMRVEDYLFPRYPGICAATLVDSTYIYRFISMYSKIKEARTVDLLRV
jgi:hypothetical protein